MDSLFVFERALLVMIGQAPARLDAEKWSAIGPQRDVRHSGKIQGYPPAARRIDIGKFPPRDINEFKNDGTGQFLFGKRHFATGKFDVAGLSG